MIRISIDKTESNTRVFLSYKRKNGGCARWHADVSALEAELLFGFIARIQEETAEMTQNHGTSNDSRGEAQ